MNDDRYYKELERSMNDGQLTHYHRPRLAGVISSMANQHNWDPAMVTVARVGMVIGAVAMVWPLFVYLILILFKED